MDDRSKQPLIAKLLAKGEGFYTADKFQEAIETFDEVLSIDPNNIRALNNKGFTLSRQVKNHEAIVVFDAVLKIYSNNVSALNNKAYVLTRLGRYQEAIGVCNEALKVNPKNTRTLRMRDFSLSKLKQPLGEIERTNEILGLNPKDSYALRNKAFYLNKSGMYKEAVDVCNELLKMTPQDIKTLRIKAFALFRTNMYREAIDIHGTILVIDPQNIESLKWKVLAVSKMQAQDEAQVREETQEQDEVQEFGDIEIPDSTYDEYLDTYEVDMGSEYLDLMLEKWAEDDPTLKFELDGEEAVEGDTISNTYSSIDLTLNMEILNIRDYEERRDDGEYDNSVAQSEEPDHSSNALVEPNAPGPDMELLEVRHGEKGEVEIMTVPWKGEPYEKEALMAIAILVDALVSEAIPFESTNRNTVILGGNYGEGEPDRIMMANEYFKKWEEWVKRQRVSAVATILESYEKL